MNFIKSGETALVQSELTADINNSFKAFASEISPLIQTSIQVERIGFTRNASNTPYIVYQVSHTSKDHLTVCLRRCCTFIKRRRFLELVTALLKLKYSIAERIKSIVSSPDFGLWIKVGDTSQYIASPYLNKFFERYNQVALEGVAPQDNCRCSPTDLSDMCIHQISSLCQLRWERLERSYLAALSLCKISQAKI